MQQHITHSPVLISELAFRQDASFNVGHSDRRLDFEFQTAVFVDDSDATVMQFLESSSLPGKSGRRRCSTRLVSAPVIGLNRTEDMAIDSLKRRVRGSKCLYLCCRQLILQRGIQSTVRQLVSIPNDYRCPAESV